MQQLFKYVAIFMPNSEVLVDNTVLWLVKMVNIQTTQISLTYQGTVVFTSEYGVKKWLDIWIIIAFCEIIAYTVVSTHSLWK